MKGFHFSLRSLLAGMAVIAVVCTAVIHPSSVVSRLLFAATILTLTLSAISAVVLVGRLRAFWGGFAALGWFYLLLTQGPWFDSHIGSQRIDGDLSSWWQTRLANAYRPPPPEGFASMAFQGFDGECTVWQARASIGPENFDGPSGQVFVRASAFPPTRVLRSISNSLIALTVALFGGVYTRTLYVLRRRQCAADADGIAT